MLRLAGFRSVAHLLDLAPGLSAPTANELGALRNVEGAAQLSAIRVYVSVYPAGSRTTPLYAGDQADFASYTAALVRALPPFNDVIIGNEPNLNRFWLPQYGPNGEDVAAPSYLSLLALLRRNEGVRPLGTGLGRRARAPRRRPAEHGP